MINSHPVDEGKKRQKQEWHYFETNGVKVSLKQLSHEDLSYLIDILVEELASRIDGGSDDQL